MNNYIKTFEEITNSIFYEQIANFHLQKKLHEMEEEIKYDKNPDHQKKILLDIKKAHEILRKTKGAQISDDTLTSIAYFARVIQQVHPGWNQDEFQKEDFKKAIENLYNTQEKTPLEKRLNEKALLCEFFKITATTLQDNHLSIIDNNGQYVLGLEEIQKWGKTKLYHPKGNVGKNISYIENQEECFDKILAFEKLNSKFPLLIAEKENNNKKIGIIALSTCMIHYGTQNQKIEEEQWIKILNAFKKNYQNWDDIIIDVRGNSGGSGHQIQEIAETLYGDKVPYCLKSEKRKTDEAKLQEFGASSTQEQETWKKRPFREKLRGLYILTDKETGSSGEAIVPMLSDYPNVQFIGENTCGCCQYGGIRPIALPCNGWVNIGSIFRSYKDGMIECIGHKPNIDCSGNDAYNIALAIIKNPTTLPTKIKTYLLTRDR